MAIWEPVDQPSETAEIRMETKRELGEKKLLIRNPFAGRQYPVHLEFSTPVLTSSGGGCTNSCTLVAGRTITIHLVYMDVDELTIQVCHLTKADQEDYSVTISKR